MQFSEYIQQCKELLAENGDYEIVTDEDNEPPMPEFQPATTGYEAAYVVPT